MGKTALFGDFGGFGAFLGPWGLPGTPFPRGFYINPSRRGPAVPRGPPEGSWRQPRPGAGYPPEEGQGVSPWAVSVAQAALPAVWLSREPLFVEGLAIHLGEPRQTITSKCDNVYL